MIVRTYLLRLACAAGIAWGSMITAAGQDMAYIGGRILGHGKKEVKIYTINNYLEYRPEFRASIMTDAEGRFATSIPLPSAIPLRVSYGRDFPMFIWAEKNDSIFIDIPNPYTLTSNKQGSTLDKGVVLFSGRGATINTYMFSAGLMIYEPKTHQRAQQRSFKDYCLFLDSMQYARLRLRRDRFPKEFSPAAEAFLQGEVIASTFYHKSMAEAYKANQTKQDSADLANPALRAYWRDWKFLPDQALASDFYRNSLMAYFHQKGREKINKRPLNDGDRESSFCFIYREAHSQLQLFPQTREYFTAFTLYQMASMIEGKDSLKVLTNHFHQVFPKSSYYPLLARRLNAKLDLTKHAPEIVAFDTANNLFSLNKLKGKPVYIDVWASWCGPCMNELPTSQKVAAKFKNKIHVVYLNISDTEQAWRRAIKKQGLESTGVHLRADKETTQKIRSAYNVGPIPRYILIDKNGNVFRSHAASPAEIEQDILSLLK